MQLVRLGLLLMRQIIIDFINVSYIKSDPCPHYKCYLDTTFQMCLNFSRYTNEHLNAVSCTGNSLEIQNKSKLKLIK